MNQVWIDGGHGSLTRNVCVCLIDALIFSHSGNGPWVGLQSGTQIFTMDTNTFVNTSMQAWACKVKSVRLCDTVQ